MSNRQGDIQVICGVITIQSSNQEHNVPISSDHLTEFSFQQDYEAMSQKHNFTT